MRILIPTLLLLVFGLVVWLLAPWEQTVLDDPARERAVESERSDDPVEETGAPRLQSGRAARQAREVGRKQPRWPVVPSDAIPTGVVDVLPLGADEMPIPIDQVQVDLHRKGAGLWAKKLPSRNAETRLWRFEGVPWGHVEIHVYGEHVRHTVQEAFIPKDEVSTVRVLTRSAGAIEYDATLRDGTRPKDVTLRLVSPRAGRPLPVHYRSIRSSGTTPPMEEAVTDAQGHVFAVPPGTYRLEATSDGGAKEVYTVTVEAGETTELPIVFAY